MTIATVRQRSWSYRVARPIIDMTCRMCGRFSICKVEESPPPLTNTPIQIDHPESLNVEGIEPVETVEVQLGVWAVCESDESFREIHDSERAIRLAVPTHSHLKSALARRTIGLREDQRMPISANQSSESGWCQLSVFSYPLFRFPSHQRSFPDDRLRVNLPRQVLARYAVEE